MNNQPVIKNAERQSNIELLRIISMIAIVGCHFATHGGFEFDAVSVTVPRLWWNLIEMGGNFGVDIFIFITGYFLITKPFKFNWQKIIKLWGGVIFYSLLFFAVSLIMGKGDLSVKEIIKNLFPITFSKWWFASTYFVLYLIHPFLNKLLNSLSKKHFQILIITMFTVWSVIPTFTTSQFQCNQLIEFVMYYSIAAYIRLFGFKSQWKAKHFFILFAVFASITYASSVVFILLGNISSVFSSHHLYLYGRNKITVLLSALCFFIAFLRITIRENKIINLIASATFGVYLIHDNTFFRSLLWFDIIKNASFQNTVLLIPYSLAAVLIVFSVCAAFELLRIYAIEKPVMKIISKNASKIERPFKAAFNKIIRLFDS